MLAASPSEAAEPKASLSRVLEQAQRDTLQQVVAYIENHESADDVEEAYRWLFESAREHRLERAVAESADAYLKRPVTKPATLRTARQVARLAQAQQGQITAACSNLQAALSGTSLRDPQPAVSFALDLLAEAQIAGDYEAARHVLTETSTVFFLNQFVRQTLTARLRKLELAGKPVPSFQVTSLDGQSFASQELANRVVLIDFWATNCTPCLEELPRLKRLQRELGSDGLLILGLSLDEDRDTLQSFVDRQQLKWPIAQLDPADESIRQAFAVETIPATFLLGPDGKVIATDLRGVNLERAIRRQIQALPGGAAGPAGSSKQK